MFKKLIYSDIFSAILNIGVDQKSNYEDAKRVRIVNGISFVGGIVLIITSLIIYFLFLPYPEFDFALINDFLFGQGEAKPIAWTNLRIIFPIIDAFLGLVCFLILFLNAKKFSEAAVFSLCFVATVYTSFFFLIGGIKVVFLYFIPAILPIVFYKQKATYISFGAANLIILFVISLILNKNNSLLHFPTGNYFPTFTINILFAFTIISLIVIHFKNQITKNEKVLAEQNKELQHMAQEISHQRDELKSKNYKLKVMNATKDKFFSIIAHDLKNPFNGILGFSSLLLKSLNDDRKKESLEYANFINTSAKNAFTLLENLLEWSRSQTGGITYKPQSIDLNILLQKSINICKNLAEVKNIEINYFQPNSISVYADENMLNTVLRNLITNAIKYTQKGGMVSISAQTVNSMVEISVTDTGIGMSNETISKLFKIHELSSTEGTEKETGTGLGLILCKNFIEKHGGKIWVESELGKGSCFRITIPYNNIPIG